MVVGYCTTQPLDVGLPIAIRCRRRHNVWLWSMGCADVAGAVPVGAGAVVVMPRNAVAETMTGAAVGRNRAAVGLAAFRARTLARDYGPAGAAHRVSPPACASIQASMVSRFQYRALPPIAMSGRGNSP